jgi:hypothetical protein
LSGFWTSAVTDGWAVFWDMAGDFLPIIGVAVGLAIFGVVMGVFFRRGSH